MQSRARIAVLFISVPDLELVYMLSDLELSKSVLSKKSGHEVRLQSSAVTYSAGSIAPIGQASAQVPQSMQTLGSIL